MKLLKSLKQIPIFITDDVEEEEYKKYIEYIKDPTTFPYDSEDIVSFEQMQKKIICDFFFDDYLFPKISDFGLSKKIFKQLIEDEEKMKLNSGQKGTVPFM